MSSIDGFSSPRTPLTLRAPDLALLRDIVQNRSGWRLGFRQTPPAQELVARLLAHRDKMLRTDAPRVRTTISVYAPNGRSAVAVSV